MAKVINLADYRKAQGVKAEQIENDPEVKEYLDNVAKKKETVVTEEELKAIAEKNKKNDERLAKERAKANKTVLRSYRIKN